MGHSSHWGMNWAEHYQGRVRCVEVQSEGLEGRGLMAGLC